MFPQTISKSRNLALLEQAPHITKEEHEKLLGGCVQFYENKNRKGVFANFIMERNYMFMMALWNTGARVSDVCMFRDSDIDTRNKCAVFVVNKLSKKDESGKIIKPVYHKVMLEDSFILAYHEYVKKWNVSGYIFTSYKMRDKDIEAQKPILARQVDYFLKDYAKVAGIDKTIHAHLYRHGIAIHMLHSGVPVDFISKFLGHHSVEVTYTYYAKITPEFAWQHIQDKTRVN